MSCCEHVCRDCGFTVMNNAPSASDCPRCGGEMMTFFDEANDRDPPEADHDEDE